MRAVLLALALVGCGGCKPATAPTTAQSVWQQLVDAGCSQPDPGGPAAIAKLHADPGQPGWLSCMFQGGSTTQCVVPCN